MILCMHSCSACTPVSQGSSLPLTHCLQRGHSACRTNQRSIQDLWKVCPHLGRRRTESPGHTSARQMEQSHWHVSGWAISQGKALISSGWRPPCCVASTKLRVPDRLLTCPHLSSVSASSTPRRLASDRCTRHFSIQAFTVRAAWTTSHT